jgi:hypothetical protein
MRLIVSFLFLFSLAMPPVPVRAAQSNETEICLMCGHVCCCPEVCAAKKIELQKKAAGCDMKSAQCRIQPEAPTGLMNSKQEASNPSPQMVLLGRAALMSRFSGQTIFDPPYFQSFSTPFEIPTPPPRAELS